MKPIAFDRFLQAVQKVFEAEASQSLTQEPSESQKDFMFVRSERKMVKINFNDIQYIESLGDYVKIFTDDQTIVTRETITNIEAKLSNDNFIRIHRSYIVSFKGISSYTNEFVEVNGKALPISRSYKESVLQKLAEV